MLDDSALAGPFRNYDARIAENGLIEIALARGPEEDPKTTISMLRTKSPLLVQRILYPDARIPAMGYVYLMTSSGGLLQGDRHSIRVTGGEYSLSHITAQASTKVYKMYDGYATQKFEIRARRGSYIEFMPHSTILYKKSRLYCHADIQLDSGATVLYSDILSVGRIASGEQFAFEAYCKELAACDSKGNPLFADTVLLEPNRQSKEYIVDLFGGKTILATVYIFCDPGKTTPIEKSIAQNFSDESSQYVVDGSGEHLIAGCSRLPFGRGIIVKMLSDSIDRIMSATQTVSAIARRHVIEMHEKAEPQKLV